MRPSRASVQLAITNYVIHAGHTEGAQRSVSSGSDEVDRVDVAKLTYIDALNFFVRYQLSFVYAPDVQYYNLLDGQLARVNCVAGV